MPRTQITITPGAHYTHHASVLAHGGSLRTHVNVVETTAVFLTGTSAISLTGAQVFGLVDASANSTASIVTLPSAAAVMPYLSQIRTGALWEFYLTGLSGQTLAILPGNGWTVSGSSDALANRQKLSGQAARVVCWVLNPLQGSESLAARIMWAF